MDNDSLRARSVELAERAYRLKDRAKDSITKIKLDDTADELIRLDNTNRFYEAQTKLEINNSWTEDLRSLAHEINEANNSLHNKPDLSITEALGLLKMWAAVYMKSKESSIRKLGFQINSSLRIINDGGEFADLKASYNQLLSTLEVVLSYILQTSIDDKQRITLLRNMRDAILKEREIKIDDLDLLKQDATEDQQVDKVNLARQDLENIYQTIKPIELRLNDV